MFIAALFKIAKTRKQPKCPSDDEWIKKMWYIYTMEQNSTRKKEQNYILFEAAWMKLESLILNDVSHNEKDKCHMISPYMQNLNYGTNEPIYRTEETHGHREQTCGCQWGGRGSGMNREFGVSNANFAFGVSKQRGPAVQHRQLHTITCDGT